MENLIAKRRECNDRLRPRLASTNHQLCTANQLGQLEEQWLDRSGMTTSITDPDELQEQIFGDLDVVEVWSQARQNSSFSASAVSAIDDFLAELKDIEDNNVVVVVSSTAWQRAKEAARAVLKSAT